MAHTEQTSGDVGVTNTSRWGWSWVLLCFALAIHVMDEALTDFLSVYNPTVEALHQRIPFLPLPVFTFKAWLTLLILAIILLLGLSHFTFRGSRWMRITAYVFGILMVVNGLAHITSSIYFGRLMPGVYSSPLLIVAAIYLLLQSSRQRRSALVPQRPSNVQ